MRYWDSSALIPFLLEEPNTRRVTSLLKTDPSIVTWWSTPIECFAALCRRKREGSLSVEDFARVKQDLTRLMDEIDFISPSDPLRERACRLVSLHPLRTGDALQLSAALRWCQDQTRGCELVTLDARLSEAALSEGFTVLPPLSP